MKITMDMETNVHTFGIVGRTIGGVAFLPLFFGVFGSFELDACLLFDEFLLLELGFVMTMLSCNDV